jgi:S1-C subfamily serine protease
LIATTLNVVEGESRIQITLSDGSTVYPVTAIAGVDAGHGLALLRVTPAVALPTVRLGDSGSVSAGARVYGLGPAGANEGAIRQLRRLSPDLTILELPAAEPQTWTGPVFDETGDVIGVSAAYVQPQGIVVVVPVNYIKRLMQQQVSLSPDEFARQTAYSAPQL